MWAGRLPGSPGMSDARLLMLGAVLALASAAPAAERDRPTAIVVSPIHEAQIVERSHGEVPAASLLDRICAVIPADRAAASRSDTGVQRRRQL